FHYYSKFNFEKDAISIKKGCTFPRSELPKDPETNLPFDAMKPVYIEEPCCGSDDTGRNTARTVHDGHMHLILRAFNFGVDALTDEVTPHMDP
ncbi:hypothetical protein PMAYCL1PPCAC_24674, partial [Pristionchus mayeri]